MWKVYCVTDHKLNKHNIGRSSWCDNLLNHFHFAPCTDLSVTSYKISKRSSGSKLREITTTKLKWGNAKFSPFRDISTDSLLIIMLLLVRNSVFKYEKIRTESVKINSYQIIYYYLLYILLTFVINTLKDHTNHNDWLIS